MGATCGCQKATSDMEIFSFRQKNSYNYGQKQDESTLNLILDRIAPGQTKQQYRKLASHIASQQKLQFFDNKFKYLQKHSNQEVNSLQKLYNFKKLKLQHVYKIQRKTSFSIFDQKDVQLCYLISVFYQICESQELKDKIFITKKINPHSCYIVHLFCNGEPCDVIVDDVIPIQKSNIKYLNIKQPEQVWPFLLQKAWCKQIGGYDKAKGLSPEDCFEQITGAPAHSYSLKQRSPNRSQQILRQAFAKDYWVVLTAIADQILGLKPRQVFFVEGYNQKTRSLLIRSPFNTRQTYSIGRATDTGAVEMTFDQVLSLFEYITVGYYLPSYANKSQIFTSKKDQQVIFEIQVRNQSFVNVRIIQFYQEYLSNQQKQFYKYSPILMQLYDSNYKIIDKCQGRLQNLSGLRSSNLCDNTFVQLNPGIYYLRAQIDWLTQKKTGEAHVAIYSPKDSVYIRKYEGDVLDLMAKLLGTTIQNIDTEKIDNQAQKLQIKFLQKSYGYVLGLQNKTNHHSQFKVIFKGSKNIKINHHQLSNNTLTVKLGPQQQRVLQVLPAQPRLEYCLAPFDIVKL